MAALIGLEEVLVRLATAAAAMAGPAAAETTRIVASHAADIARDLAPVGGADDPHAGALRDAIGVEGDGPAAELVCNVDYAAAQEFGSIHNPPHPFFRPALHRAEAELPAVARTTYRATVPYLE